MNAEKLAAVNAAKKGVEGKLAQIHAAREAIKGLEVDAAPSIEALVKAAGRPGPFKISDGNGGQVIVNFRKHPDGSGRYVMTEQEEAI